MNEDVMTALLTEIRDLQRQQLEALQQTVTNQTVMMATQQTVLKRQEEQIQRQTDQRELNARVRRWSRVAVWVALALAFVWILQPWLFFLVAGSIANPRLH